MKKRNLFMAATIMCALFTVAFTFKMDQVDWLWADNKPVAIVFAAAALFFATQWLKHRKLVNQSDKN